MASARRARPLSRDSKNPKTLLLIALFKLLKGVLLVVVGIGALRLLHRDLAETVMHWVNVLRVDPDNRIIHRLLTRVVSISPAQLKATSVGTFIYAGLLLTEGTGLLLRKRWAEYFTIITTGGLIPLELYEISKHATMAKFAVLIVNLAILAYLVMHVRKTR
uniref:DUF2127 domain-containing protein n=1 Tax=uncultured bacterium 89 TaxID=698393 RepID=E3T6A2_9BACT|nr:hypothetical protein [uncultured bacterium 89]